MNEQPCGMIMSGDVRPARRSDHLSVKPGGEVLDAYLATCPLAHAMHRIAETRQVCATCLRRPLLDLGCGSGEFALAALRDGVDVGVDLAARPLARAAATGRYVALVQADGGRLPFGDGRFRTVLALSVLEHVAEPRNLLSEAFRVLAPGGRFVATLVLADLHEHLFYPRLLRRCRLSRLAGLYCRLQDRLFAHRSLLPRRTWEEWFRDSGFDLLDSRPIVSPRLTLGWDLLLPLALPFRLGRRFGCSFLWHPPWFRRLLAPLCRVLLREHPAGLGSNMFVVARKPGRLRRRSHVRKTSPVACGLHADRAAGCPCHHRGPHGLAAAGGDAGP